MEKTSSPLYHGERDGTHPQLPFVHYDDDSHREQCLLEWEHQAETGEIGGGLREYRGYL